MAQTRLGQVRSGANSATSSAPPSSPPSLSPKVVARDAGLGQDAQVAESELVSRTSLNTVRSNISRKEYLESLVAPTRDELERIAAVQINREAEHRRQSRELHRRSQSRELRRRSHEQSPRQSLDQQSVRRQEGASGRSERVSTSRNGRENPILDDAVRAKAATLIQRTYRGYRARREMKGLGVNASTRWMYAIREAQFREAIRPRAKEMAGNAQEPIAGANPDQTRSVAARNNWKRIAIIARRAAIGEDTATEDDESSTGSSGDDNDRQKRMSEQRRREANAKRRQESKMMDLQYFLEMVDLKHRYGANLRRYHDEWQRSDTKENFFYWLDYGAGRFVEVDTCPRDQLEREQVRYLSHDERQYYLVKVDSEGRLCWAKNGVRIDTTEEWKDSIHGIVPMDDPTPQYIKPRDHHPVDARPSVELDSESDTEHHTEKTPAMTTVHHTSLSSIMDRILRGAVKKNTWIFVADTSFRLYVGIKASGAFQHSSFLQGSRISAAGLIKIKNGRLSSLSPMSGHYRPPTSNFRAFVRNLREAGVDMHHVAISKSYAVLLGLEVYVKTRQKVKKAVRRLSHHTDKIVAPEEARRRAAEEKSQSPRERRQKEILEEEEDKREGNEAVVQMLQKLHIEPREPAVQQDLVAAGPQTAG